MRLNFVGHYILASMTSFDYKLTTHLTFHSTNTISQISLFLQIYHLSLCFTFTYVIISVVTKKIQVCTYYLTFLRS